MKKVIIIVGVLVLLLGVGGGAALFLLKDDTPADAAADAAGAAGADDPAATPVAVGKKPIYFGLNPDFVVAFQNPKNVRFIKASIEVVTYESSVIDDLKLHMPAVRDGVLTVFGKQTEAGLSSPEGKEAFRAEVLASVRNTLQQLTGNPGVELVYFTNYVMQ